MRRFWEIEEIDDSQNSLSQEEQKILERTEKLFGRSKDNQRYQIGIPWNENQKNLRSNYEVAVKRLKSTEDLLERKPEVKKLYEQNIQEYLRKEYIRKVKDGEEISKWFLPHFPIVKMNKTSSKVRMVLDAASRSNGMCLNDAIDQGPKLQNDMIDILLRFRKNRIGVTCDISEMYLQIELRPEDRQYHRFLWRDCQKGQKPEVYEFNRVVFGVNALKLCNFIRSSHIIFLSKIPCW